MKKYIEGMKSQGICEHCGKGATTFKKRNMPVSGCSIVVSNLLIAVCDKCDRSVGIPQSESEQIKQELERNEKPL